jgi:nascent polypeptide-associated complex subunit alpha
MFYGVLALWFGGRPEEMVRVLRRLGVSIEEVDAVKVTVELGDGTLMVVEPPEAVLLVKSRDQPPVFMVVGSHRVERPRGSEVRFSEDDVRFVAERAGVSLEEARKALEESGGDIAAAILKLGERSS